MLPFTTKVKNIKGADHKDGGVDGMLVAYIFEILLSTLIILIILPVLVITCILVFPY